MARRSITPILVVGAAVAGILLYQRANAAPMAGLGITPGWTPGPPPRPPMTQPRATAGGVWGSVSSMFARSQARAWAKKYRTSWSVRSMAEFYAKYSRTLWPVITAEFEKVWGPRPPELARAGVDYWKLGKP